MRILHLISSSGFFGAENVALNLMNSLKEDQNNPHLLCLKNSGKPDPEIHLQAKEQGIYADTVSCRSRFDMGAIGKIREFIDENKIELIHSHGYKSNLYGMIASRLSHIPIVATLHGWMAEDNKARLYEMVDRWIIKGMNHIVSVSPIINEELEVLGIDGGKVSFIPNGIDTEKFSPYSGSLKWRDLFGAKNALTIGTVGRLGPEKGHLYLMKAFKGISSFAPDAKLLIVGDGHLRESLEEDARNLGIEKNVVFTGFQKDMVSVYKRMDIFVLPSLKEGLPMVLLEAMSMELPIVASEVGGIPHVVNMEEGILIPPGDADALKNAILLLSENSNFREEMGRKARKKVLSGFSLRPFYQKYKDTYKKILN